MANPNNIEETYAEIRWISPGDEPVRWVVGASVFDYTFLTNIFTQLAGIKRPVAAAPSKLPSDV